MALRLGLGVVLPDVLNVRDFGALGNNSHDDTAAVQAAIDSAFGTAGSPNGTNATLNKALFFPQGNYLLNSGPVVFTQVRGARIFGAGNSTTTITGPTGCVVTNGMEYSSFENISFSAGSGATTVFELDWNNTGSIGLKGNIFTNCNFGSSGKAGAPYGFRIAFSGNGGANNQFYGCQFGYSGVGFVTWGAAATGQYMQGGGVTTTNTAVWIKAGQIAAWHEASLSDNTTQDFLMDTDGPILIKGTRTESGVFVVCNSVNSVAVLDGCMIAHFTAQYCKTKGKAILDSCATEGTTQLCSDAAYIGKVYARGCYFPSGSFFTAFTGNGGTVAQNI